jgi:NitT/TauT family transport system ATP-binding protein
MQSQPTVGPPLPAVTVRNLSKCYLDRHNGGLIQVLNNISFDIEPGEILGIFGPSGCGKTSLLRILCGILTYEGSVSIYGQPASKQRGVVAYVPQRAELLDWKTLRGNALLGYTITKKWRDSGSHDVNKRVDELFEQFRLSHAKSKYPLQCSGGERQRAALIRAFMTPASIVALDEPAGAIDHISRSRIYENLLEIIQADKDASLSTTTLIISHDPEELLFLCDRIIVMPARPYAEIRAQD